MSHTHRCCLCTGPICCDGYAVGCREDGDLHCIAEDDGPMLCRECGEEQEALGYDAHDAACDRADHHNKDEREG